VWQIEWMFSLIPHDVLLYLIHAITITSFVGLVFATILKKIPFINNYARILAPVFFFVLLAGVYFEGSLGGKEDYLKKLAEMQEKVKVAEEKSQQVNEVIKTVYVDKVKVIKQKGKDNVKYIEKVVTKYDNLCTLSNAAIRVHNSASQNQVATSAGGADEGTSDVKASELIKTVTDNYSTYYQTREQVIGWQQWYKEQKKIYESVK